MKFSILLTTLLTASAFANPAGYAPKKPLVSSKQLQRTITRSALLKHADALEHQASLSGGSRAFGSKGHNATVDYIKKSLDKTGYYDTRLQTFPYLFSEGTANFTVAGTAYNTAWLTYGPAGNVTASLVAATELGCIAANFPSTVTGKIVLIKRGTCEFGLKVSLAGAAGAAGAIIYNNADGAVGGGTLGSPSRDTGPYIPSGSITGLDGTKILAALATGDVIGNVYVKAINEIRYTSNVIATTKGGDKKNIISAGGHTDSVPAGPGVNDDGSGSMGILEIALQLPRWSVKNAVRFAFWTAEEYGLVGSEHYVASLNATETADIAVYLNADMIASPNYGYFLYDGDGSAFGTSGPNGSDHIEHLFEDYFTSIGVKTAPTEFDGRSDYGPFLDVGIPSGGIFTGAEGNKTAEQAVWWGGDAGVAYDVNYHGAGDGKVNLAVGAWVTNVKAFAHVIATYSNSLSGIPRGLKGKRSTLHKKQLDHDKKRHSACNHDLYAL